MMRMLNRLHHEWTKNDGKPREDWAPGRDLKETVLVVALAICTALMALLIGVQALR